MDSKFKLKIKISKKSKLTLVLTAVTSIVILSLFPFLFQHYMEASLSKDIKLMLSEITKKEYELLSQKTESDFQRLDNLADVVAQTEDPSEEYLNRLLETSVRNGLGTRLVLMDLEGNGISSDGTRGSLWTGSDTLNNSLANRHHISNIEPGLVNPDEKVIILTSQIRRDGKTEGIIAAVHELESYQKLMAITDFNGQGESFIVSLGGDAIVWPDTDQPLLNAPHGAASALTDSGSGETLVLLMQEMKAGNSGVIDHVNASGTSMYVSYRPLGISDWYLLNATPTSTVANRAQQATHMATLCAVILLLITAVLTLSVWISHQMRIAMAYKTAFYDGLTGLPNWQYLEKYLGDMDGMTENIAFVLLNIPNFTQIYQVFGDNCGLLLMKNLTKMLVENVREGELAARALEDYFALFLHYDTEEELTSRLNGLFDQLQRIRITDGNLTYHYQCKFFGGAYRLGERNREHVEDIYEKMRLVIRNLPPQKNCYWAYYSGPVQEQMQLDLTLIGELARALKEGAFIPHFQPQYDLSTGELSGVELLARWNHPTLGILHPRQFLHLLEQAGCILELDMIMLEEACRLLKVWLNNGLLPVPLSVNMARLNLHRHDFVDRIMTIIHKYQVPCNLIVLELTESAIIDNVERVAELTRMLHKEGFILAIDDFGSGHSSMHMLHKIVADEIKISRSYFPDFSPGSCESSQNNRLLSVITRIVELCRDLKIDVIAEDVENKEQEEFFRSAGCNHFQGYLYAKPMPQDEFEKLVFPE